MYLDSLFNVSGLSDYFLSFHGIGQLHLLKNVCKSLNSAIKSYGYYIENKPLFLANSVQDLPKENLIKPYDMAPVTALPLLTFFPRSYYANDVLALNAIRIRYRPAVSMFLKYLYDVPQYIVSSEYVEYSQTLQTSKILGLLLSGAKIDIRKIADLGYEYVYECLFVSASVGKQDLFKEIFDFLAADKHNRFHGFDHKQIIAIAFEKDRSWIHTIYLQYISRGKFDIKTVSLLRGKQSTRMDVVNPYLYAFESPKNLTMSWMEMLVLYETKSVTEFVVLMWSLFNDDIQLIQELKIKIPEQIHRNAFYISHYREIHERAYMMTESLKLKDVDPHNSLCGSLCILAVNSENKDEVDSFASCWGWKPVVYQCSKMDKERKRLNMLGYVKQKIGNDEFVKIVKKVIHAAQNVEKEGSKRYTNSAKILNNLEPFLQFYTFYNQ